MLPLLRSWLSVGYVLAWLLVGLGVCPAARAQPASADLLPPRFLPTSPTISTLPRFDAQQLVNLPTGAAQLAVPLAEITSGPLHLPVTLAYSYSGLQVYQPKDLVGLGWSLQAGSAITLQVNGRLDAQLAGPTVGYNPDTVSNASQAFLERVTRNTADSGPDIYAYTLPSGLSGHFTLRDTALVLLPQQPVRIRLLHDQPGGSFLVITEEGVRYLFRATELTHPSNKFALTGYTSAWHLTHIISADAADTVQLHYTQLFREPTPIRCAVTTGTYNTGIIWNVYTPGGSSAPVSPRPVPSAPVRTTRIRTRLPATRKYLPSTWTPSRRGEYTWSSPARWRPAYCGRFGY